MQRILLLELFKTIHDGDNDVGPTHIEWTICKCQAAERIREMGDSLHLSGPDANMERDLFMAEQERAEKMDNSKIIELLSNTFVKKNKKTIDAMSIEEILKHKYNMEETVRTLRVHLLVIDRAERKLKVKVSDKVFKDLDKTYKPKPIPESRQANDKFEKLVNEIMIRRDCTREEAIEFLK